MTKVYIVAVNYREFFFKTKEDAEKFYNLVSSMEFMNLEHRMLDKYDPDRKNYSGYEYLFYINENRGSRISLSNEEYNILPQSEVEQRAAKRDEEVKEFKKNQEAEKKKAKINKQN